MLNCFVLPSAFSTLCTSANNFSGCCLGHPKCCTPVYCSKHTLHRAKTEPAYPLTACMVLDVYLFITSRVGFHQGKQPPTLEGCLLQQLNNDVSVKQDYPQNRRFKRFLKRNLPVSH